MKRVFDVVVKQDESGWYIGSVPELPGCHTQGKTLAQLKRRIVEAIELHLDGERPPSGDSKYVGIHRVEVAA
ncbi:MAG TPA: type II toxin-antitoxin system HicB family antitoxin [Candidatus Thermoplasmatota archaeon]|nr:type II toxin-antitoxin system HicB family antitoxin [Candidatus Thermoplasmatota archaeon]